MFLLYCLFFKSWLFLHGVKKGVNDIEEYKDEREKFERGKKMLGSGSEHEMF